MPRSVSYSDAHDYGPDSPTFNLRTERESIPRNYDAHEAVLRLAHLVIDNPINAYILCIRIVMPELPYRDIAQRAIKGFRRTRSRISEDAVHKRCKEIACTMPHAAAMILSGCAASKDFQGTVVGNVS